MGEPPLLTRFVELESNPESDSVGIGIIGRSRSQSRQNLTESDSGPKVGQSPVVVLSFGVVQAKWRVPKTRSGQPMVSPYHFG